MEKRVLILTGSPRTGGNSDLLAEAFAKGAKAAGHTVTTFKTAEKNIKGCIACETCYSKGMPCSMDDDYNELAPLLEAHDALVLATPLYWYTFPAQIKAAIDKMYAAIIGERMISIGECLLLCVGETDDLEDFQGIVKSYEKIADLMEWTNCGNLLVPGVHMIGDILKTDALAQAQKLGANAFS